MATLKTVFKADGVVTAANSSQITDGAAAVLIMERGVAEKLGYRPMARFVEFALAAEDPVLMLGAPIPATRKIMERSGLKLEDMDRIEINEAFASVVLAWQRETKADLAQGQRQRRRNCSRTSAGRKRRSTDDDAGARTGTHRRSLRNADHVRRRRHGQRNYHRTADSKHI